MKSYYLCSAGRRFCAHRICLLASSDAFRAMFDGGYLVSKLVRMSVVISSNIPLGPFFRVKAQKGGNRWLLFYFLATLESELNPVG